MSAKPQGKTTFLDHVVARCDNVRVENRLLAILDYILSSCDRTQRLSCFRRRERFCKGITNGVLWRLLFGKNNCSLCSRSQDTLVKLINIVFGLPRWFIVGTCSFLSWSEICRAKKKEELGPQNVYASSRHCARVLLTRAIQFTYACRHQGRLNIFVWSCGRDWWALWACLALRHWDRFLATQSCPTHSNMWFTHTWLRLNWTRPFVLLIEWFLNHFFIIIIFERPLGLSASRPLGLSASNEHHHVVNLIHVNFDERFLNPSRIHVIFNFLRW
jgi:hypothetical protein